MGLFALAVAPGIAICLFIYFKDRHNREPRKLLFWSFILGVLSVIPALFAQLAIGATEIGRRVNVMDTAIDAFLVVALTEELSKFLVLRYYCYPKKAFDDPFDGIIYSVMIGMGFATIENIGYVYQHGIIVGIMRLFMAVPGHATFAVLMGYYVGLAKFNPAKSGRYFLAAILLAVTFHGFYDFFLFLGKGWITIMGALISLIVAVKLSLKAIKKKQEISRLYFEANNIM